MTDSESDSSASDWEFKMIKCGICEEPTIGKSMWRCCECEQLICQSCDPITRGCSHDSENSVCKACFDLVYKGRHKYCTLERCRGCNNKTPQFKAARKREEVKYEQLKATVDIEAWKKDHPPINYKGKYFGRYLIDLYFSSSSFERGYIDWLIQEGGKPKPKTTFTKEQNENFQKYVEEAKQLKQMVTL